MVDALVGRLRDLARDIEQNVIENWIQLVEQAEIWERDENHPDIDEETGYITELATTNPTDLVDDGYRELILEQTMLEDVVSLAVRS
ncbi:hypothetical protein [Salinigranum marinum]|uniref:hypothetical protein n=1 Tax=Salinigranum marinum TaxID=1515595 RepID=UPI002989DD51|nr:hypothetical protein [Salinigranum marinum]